MLDDTSRRLQAVLPGEHRVLQRHYTVSYDPTRRLVTLADIELPPDWQPRSIAVVIKLPPHYPRPGPRWRFPWTIRYQGRVPRHLLTRCHWLVRGTLGDPILYWPRQWDPQRSTLYEETNRALEELLAVDPNTQPEVACA